MRIRIHNRVDGLAILRCERADGSVTWQRHPAKNSRFFPPHDLTHYAVETTLGFRDAFYGLVASGWELSDFGHPWPRGRLPAEAGVAEFLVGCLDLERLSGEVQTVEEVNAGGTRQCGDAWQPITEDQLARLRSLTHELTARWHALPPDGELALDFTPREGL
jgi:hypothetical protein